MKGKIFQSIGTIVVIALVVTWALWKHGSDGGSAEVTLGFKYDTFVDGWNEAEYQNRFSLPSNSVDFYYKGRLERGEIEIAFYTLHDGEYILEYKETLTEPGDYEKTISVNYHGEYCNRIVRYKEGSEGSFVVGYTAYTNNWNWYFGKRNH